jgi:hypothetical protein
MKNIISSLCLSALLFLGSCNKNSSFHPGQDWKDNNGISINAHGGGILLYQNTYYWYGEHKIAGEIGNSAQVGFHVYPSKDLYNWTDEGLALKIDEKDTINDICRGSIMERPKVLYNKKTGKFVMWFHLELRGKSYNTSRSGIAIADKPTGPFKFIRSLRPNKDSWPVNVKDFHKKPVASWVEEHYAGGWLPKHADTVNILGRDFNRGQMARDMTLFLDDDGKAYHIYASEENSTLHISQLTDDYLSYSGKYARAFINRFMEAPTIFKDSKGKYYFIGSGCTGWYPNAARSAVADHIFGPWVELGNPCVGEDTETTFHTQGTYILSVQGKKDAFIFMADRWTPENAINGKYVWLPIRIENDRLILEWKDKWDLSVFK